METETRQTRHHHLRHHHQGSNWIYIILGIIISLPLIWYSYGYHANGESIIGKWHPFYDVEYSLAWYLTLMSIRLKTVLYPIAILVAKERHYPLIYIFIAYEGIMFIDSILFYAQSFFYYHGIQIGMRIIFSIILAITLVWYHYKYE